MSVDPYEQIFLRDPQIISQMIDGEAVLVMPAQGKVKVVNEVGARIWELSDGKRCVREIASELVKEFRVELKQANGDTLAFLEALAQRGLVRLAQPD